MLDQLYRMKRQDYLWKDFSGVTNAFKYFQTSFSRCPFLNQNKSGYEYCFHLFHSLLQSQISNKSLNWYFLVKPNLFCITICLFELKGFSSLMWKTLSASRYLAFNHLVHRPYISNSSRHFRDIYSSTHSHGSLLVILLSTSCTSPFHLAAINFQYNE